MQRLSSWVAVAVLALSLTAQADHSAMKPGLWKVTVTMEMPGRPIVAAGSAT